MWDGVYAGLVWVSNAAGLILLAALLYKLATYLVDEVFALSLVMPDLAWKHIGVVAGAFVLLFAGRLGASFLSDRDLRTQTLALSEEIIRYADERQQGMPTEDPKSWGRYTRQLSQYAAETRQLYEQRYSARVAAVRERFFTRGLTDNELDTFRQNANHPMAIRTVGERLAYLAQQLR